MNNLTTEAGQTNSDKKHHKVDAINQVFTLFRLNYHNQYLKAFSNIEELNNVKRIWLDTLARYEPTILLKAAKRVIETQEYLPTIRTMLDFCEQQDPSMNFPDVHSAYIEACRAPSPKKDYKWSHPIVYHAGKSCDWFFLQTNSEKVAFPIFSLKYKELLERAKQGEQFERPEKKEIAPPKKIESNDSTNANETLKKLRHLFDE